MKKVKQSQLTNRTSLLLMLVVLLLIVIGGTYALYSQILTGTKENVIRAANLTLTLDETTESGITLTKAIPIDDEKGKETNPYQFTLRNDGDVESKYTIYLEDIDTITNTDTNKVTTDNRMDDQGVDYYFTSTATNITGTDNKDKVALVSTLNKNSENPAKRVLETGTIEPGKTYTYNLRLWIAKNATYEQVNGKIFAARLSITAEFSDNVVNASQ